MLSIPEESLAALRPRVICIPVLIEEVPLLLETWSSIIRNTMAETEILLLTINIDPVFLQKELPNSAKIKIIKTTGNHDPWQVMLQKLPTEYAEHDVVILRPGVEVPPGWDARLALSAYRQPEIAATVPMCDSTPFFSLLEPGKTNCSNLGFIDQLLLSCSPRHDFEIPTLFSGCTYLRRTALNIVNPQIASQPVMAAGEWCQWLATAFREQGWCVLICDHVYLLDHAPEYRQNEMADIEELEDVRIIKQVHPLTGLRFAMHALLNQGTTFNLNQATRPPVQLHITHSWGGGLDYWVQQYCENDQARNNLVLRSIGTWGAFGQRIALYRSAAMDRPLRYWDLNYPIRATALVHVQYREILSKVITGFGVESILISSLIGHALDALTTQLPTVIITHDYYPFCPAIVIHFEQVCTFCEPEQLELCFAKNKQNRFFRNVNATEWLSLRRRFAQLAVTHSVRFVVPSPVVAHYWKTLVPELRNQSFTVIAHGLNFAPPRLTTESIAGNRLRVVILGSLALQKGQALLDQIWPLIAHRVDLYLVGCDSGGEAIQSHQGITIIPHYDRAKLSDLMTSIQPELGLLLSIWPETFSYTLSELWLLGIPVMATDLGSFADRIQDNVNGFLCPPQAEVIADRLLAIAADRSCLEPVRKWLANFRHRSVAEMIADYHNLIPLPEFSATRYFSASVVIPETPVVANHHSALHIDAQAPFSTVLGEFGQYVGRKLVTTPRLRPWQKTGLAIFLRWCLNKTTRWIQTRSKILNSE